MFLGFTQYLNSCNKTLKEQDIKKSLIVTINNINFTLWKAMEGSMTIEFKPRKRAWTCELNIWSTIWNIAIHPMMKITQFCVVSMIYNNVKWYNKQMLSWKILNNIKTKNQFDFPRRDSIPMNATAREK
jgi:hypothetical protein